LTKLKKEIKSLFKKAKKEKLTGGKNDRPEK
jgi:hypothetical protein